MICSPLYPIKNTARLKPFRAKSCSWRSANGCPATGASAFGILSVRGRSRVANPPASIAIVGADIVGSRNLHCLSLPQQESATVYTFGEDAEYQQCAGICWPPSIGHGLGRHGGPRVPGNPSVEVRNASTFACNREKRFHAAHRFFH